MRRRGHPIRTTLALAVLLAAGVAALLARGHGFGALLESRAASAAPTAPLPRTELVSAPGRVIRNGSEPIAVTLSAPVWSGSPAPTLQPAVAGTWTVSGDSEVFTPVSTLEPCSSYTLTVWARTTSDAHAPLGHRRTIALSVACPPLAGLQQALAHLGYLAAKLHPRYLAPLPPNGPETRRAAAQAAYHPPRGALVPDPADAPPVDMGQLDQTTRGALMVYQSDHDLEATGEPDRDTWASLLAAMTDYRRDPQAYTWVTVSESLPETLEVHRGDRVAFSTPANTGVPGAETARGIFPIYSRLVSTTMTGEDVDGSKYDVSDVPWVNYFNGGDAVHGYPREAYGFPQSNGCVELPIEASHTVFEMLAIGDIVEVDG